MSLGACTDRENMNFYFLLISLFSFSAQSASGLRGVIILPKGCSSPVMVWVALDKDQYKERLLLMHTEVPAGGSFQFYLKPGEYQVRGSDEKGCEFFQRVTVKDFVEKIQVKMVEK